MNQLAGTDLERLTAVLAESQRRGFIGPGPLAPQVERAVEFSAVVPDPPHRVLDLGSGGGLPGLPLALLWRSSEVVLLDGSVTRSRFLAEAVESLDLEDRVQVVAERAEVAGRGSLRGGVDLVVARSFGPPGVTAECAAPFLRVGGRLVVAEPPGGAPDRWVASGLARLAMRAAGSVAEPSAFQVLEQIGPCPPEFPRRTGIPTKRPLF